MGGGEFGLKSAQGALQLGLQKSGRSEQLSRTGVTKWNPLHTYFGAHPISIATLSESSTD